MGLAQRLITRFCSPATVERMRRETNQWQLRCRGCGAAVPLWEAGGIRYKKRAKGSFSATLMRCRSCGGLHIGVAERVPEKVAPGGSPSE